MLEILQEIRKNLFLKYFQFSSHNKQILFGDANIKKKVREFKERENFYISYLGTFILNALSKIIDTLIFELATRTHNMALVIRFFDTSQKFKGNFGTFSI